MRLFIVESPAKCQKIRSYLGDGWKVIASMGHVRGLEESLAAVGIENGWNPRFEVLKGKTKAVKEIKDAAKGATEVWLGTDDDREGEAIAWHLCHLLKLSPENTPRAIFHEVTETAIQASVADKNKRLNGPMVQAQFARSMLDLLVGFSISPVLWKNIAYGLSAGRCQTPALHLVFDKEMEIAGFASKQSWVYEANFTPVGLDFPIACTGTWFPTSLEEVRTYLAGIPAVGKLVDIADKTSATAAPMPLITSSLQQECSSVYHINPKTTMMIAQRLYEAGHITYMRTDNPVLGMDCLAECREFVEGKYGETYLNAGGVGKKKKKAKAEKEAVVQGAHEAIHPTHMDLVSLPTEETWSDQDRKVYSHIWKRTLQSVMAASQQKSRSFTFQLDGASEKETWKGSLSMLVFKGWKILNEENDTEKEEQFAKTDSLSKNGKAKWSDMVGRQVATQPPSRFSEAQLVQQLEEKGIGRPSTFASLIATILDRKYVEKKTSKGVPVDLYKLEKVGPKGALKETTVKKDVGGDKDKIHLTSLGKSVIDFVDTRFSDIFAYGFTAEMEEDLDLVAHGKKERVTVLDGLWNTMKDRVGDNATGPAGSVVGEGPTGQGNTKSLKEFVLENGVTISIANTKKGVLLIKKTPGVEKAEFAAMPPTADATTMTQEDAEALFVAKEGDSLGDLDGFPVLLKKGQFGQYAEWNGIKHSYKEGTEFEELCTQLKNKTSGTQDTDSALPTFCRVVGDYTIKRGPYGLFFYRGGAAKRIFAKFPAGLVAETISVADCASAYKLAADSKGSSGGGFRGRGRGRGRGH